MEENSTKHLVPRFLKIVKVVKNKEKTENVTVSASQHWHSAESPLFPHKTIKSSL